ncbi:MAG: hypothetical protein COB53_05510 [Elusimicrobia bacterium]|nr:MAG: hypothetical protein COB53_05510 [Elusimicrobiota bacterium]
MTIGLLLGALLAFVHPAFGQHSHAGHSHQQRHDMPVHPVHARMLVDPGMLRLRVVTDGAILGNDLLGLDLGVSNWPEEKRHAAKEWLDDQIMLAADGKPLTSQLVNASFRIDAWKKVADVGIAGWDGMFIFDLTYTFPAEARTISGRISFYEADWEYLESMLDSGVKPMFQKNFKTYLKVPGRANHDLEIGIENSEFSLPLETATRSGLQRLREAATLGVRLPWPILYTLFALVFLTGGMAPGMIGAIALPAITLFAFGLMPAGTFAAAAPWLALSIAAFGFLKKPTSKYVLGTIAFFSGLFLGVGLSSMQGPLTEIPMSPVTAKLGFLLGSLTAAGIAGAASFFGLKSYRAYLMKESEQMATRLLEKNGKFMTFGIGAFGVIYAAQILLGR